MRCPTLHELPAPPPGKCGWPWTEDGPRLPDPKPDGQTWPRISVVTPSYNQGRFIEETIRSVLLQGYPDLEYIIVDGGSTDASLETIRSYEPWLAYSVSEPDRGQTHAIKKGWARATGDVVAYINADDFYLHGAIFAAARAFSVRPDAGMVYGTALIVDDQGQALRAWEAQPFDLRTMLTVGSIVPQPSTFFSAAALKEAGSLNDEWHMIMDYELCIRLGIQYPAVCIPQTLASFRAHEGSKSRRRFEAMAHELIEFVKTFNPGELSPSAWRRIRRATLGRIYLELTLAHFAQEKQERSKASKQLLKSILVNPLWPLRRPLLAAHVVKRMLVLCLEAVRARMKALLT